MKPTALPHMRASGLLLAGALLCCTDHGDRGVFGRVTGSNLAPQALLTRCSNYPSTDGSAFQIYSLPAKSWSAASDLAVDHPLPTDDEKSWIRQPWERGSLKESQPLISQIAGEAVRFAFEGECTGERGKEFAQKATESAMQNATSYYAFLHKEAMGSDRIPAMRLYMIDEVQSVFIVISDDQ